MHKTFFGAVVLAISLCGVASADDQADARAILDQGIKAHGGAAALGKFVGISFKVKGSDYDGDDKIPKSYECYFQGDNIKRLVSYDENHKIDIVEVVNGKEGWVKATDQAAKNLTEEQLKLDREDTFVNWATTTLVPLKAEGFRLSLLEETSVAGRKAVGILVSHEKHNPLKLYFDKETHLLVKYRRNFKNADVGREVDEECVWSDFRNVQGTKQPFKADISWDGAKFADQLLSDMKFYDKPLDKKLFMKP